MGRDGKKKQKEVVKIDQTKSAKKTRLKPYKKKHVNHRSRDFWKDYNDDYDELSKFDEEE